MLILNGKILTMAGNVYKRGFIQTNGRVIEAVGTMEDLEYEKRNDENEILDVNGAWVMPGMIEAHCHIGITEDKHGMIGDDCNEMVNPITADLRAIDAINPMDAAFHEAIMAGITSVMVGPGSSNVVGGQFAFIKTQGRCIDDMIVKAPAAMKIAFGENPKTNYGDNNQMPCSRMGIAAMLREELTKASHYKKQKECKKLESIDLKMEAWIPVLNCEIPLKAHVHRADDILTAIRIAKEFGLNLTLDHCTEGHLIADKILESGFPAIVGPGLTARSKIELQNMSFKTNYILNQKGILIAITTDHPVSVIKYLPLCAGLAVKQGLPLEEGLKAITINAAKICGVDHQVGSLEVGKDADIAIFDGNPMEVFTNLLYTIINGKLIYKNNTKNYVIHKN